VQSRIIIYNILSATGRLNNNYCHGEDWASPEKKKDNILEAVRIWKEMTEIKVTNTVTTFLKETSDGFKVPATKTEPKKVTDMVGTFSREGSNGFRVSFIKVKPEKVTDMVGTFLNEASNGFPDYQNNNPGSHT
jgi:hypothetical protein